jgi:hypothetical protein
MNDNGAMRVLFCTRGSSGHVTPLAAFGHACVRAGHQVLVTAHRGLAANVERTGLACAPLDDPPPESWMPMLSEFAQTPVAEAHERMIGDFFGRVDVGATLPGLRSLVESWRPDVIVRESWEFASTLVAEVHEIPLARVGLGTAAVEEDTIALVAGSLDAFRAWLELPADPRGERLRAAPYLTQMPEQLEEPGVAMPAHRFRERRRAPAAGLGDWWPRTGAPLVYVSFGTVTAGSHLPYYPALYRSAIDAVAELPARVLLTVGEDRALEELGPLPENVHVERWVPQAAVLELASVVACHGGHGSTLGALAAGVPLVVMPLFSMDQDANGAAVERAGAGVVVGTALGTRRALEVPSPEAVAGLGGAIERVLGDDAYRRGAGRVAAEMAALPPVDAAVDVLADLSARSRRSGSGPSSEARS